MAPPSSFRLIRILSSDLYERISKRQQAVAERVDGGNRLPGRSGTPPGKLSSRHALISLRGRTVTTRSRVRTISADLVPAETKKNTHTLFVALDGLHVLGKFSFLGKNLLILGRIFFWPIFYFFWAIFI